MKRWIVNLLSMLIGLTISFLLVDNQLLMNIFIWVSGLFLIVVPYITYGMLFFLVTAGVASLNLQNLTRKTISHTLYWIFAAFLLLMITGGFFAYLMPSSDLDLFVTSNVSLYRLYPSTEVLKRITGTLSGSQYRPFYRSYGLILPILGIAFYLGYGITPTKEVLRPAFSVVNSFSEVCYKLLSGIGFIMNIGLTCMTGILISRLITIQRWLLIQQLLFYLLFAALIVILLILPLLIVIFTKERRPFKLITGLTSPVLLALGSGTSSYSLPMTIEHTRINLGTAKRVTSVSAPIISLAGRAGSAFVSCFILIGFQTAHTGGQSTPMTTLMILLVCGSLSLFSYAFPGFELVFICLGTSHLLGLHITDEILIAFILILRPMLQAVSAGLDTLICGLGAASCGYVMHSHIPVTRKERI